MISARKGEPLSDKDLRFLNLVKVLFLNAKKKLVYFFILL